MPKEGAMTQISRPFQIALAAVVLLAAVWFIALRGHSSGAGSSASTPTPTVSSPASSGGSSASASSPSTAQSAPGGGTNASSGQTYTGSAPGIAGLTRAIAKAQGAVKDSEQNAKALQQKAAQASSASQAAASSSQSATAPSYAPSVARAAPAPTSTGTHVGTHAPAASSAASKQAVVEGELKQERMVIVLFWSPKGAVDVVDHNELAVLQAFDKRFGTGQNRNIAVHYSSAAEVGQYGTITRALQVFQTPTMLVISPSGQTKTLTGLVDAYAIQQAIKEARHS
ncbi:MAG TPA: hypothetical protein VGX69_10910 [Solirubrobacteraceae bacterium]|jgi:hypothetical protein|nr:hypothetical protein [Solirubrobacteraceae bacterium]